MIDFKISTNAMRYACHVKFLNYFTVALCAMPFIDP